MKIFGKKLEQNTNLSLLLLLSLFVSSCSLFNQKEKKTPLAKVYDKVLYLEDIKNDFSMLKSKEDSLIAINKYIEDWAYETLLVESAKRNIDTLQIHQLVKQYEKDLLMDTYKDLLAEKYLDTFVAVDSIKKYYNNNKTYFKAKEPLVKPIYIVFNDADKNKYKYQKWFFSKKIEHKDSLLKRTPIFKKMDIEGEKWYTLKSFREELPRFSRVGDKQILKKSKKFILKDSLGLYLVLIKDRINIGEPLAFNFVKEDLKQLLLNQRKRKVIAKLKKEIKEEAIKKKHFELYKIHKNDE